MQKTRGIEKEVLFRQKASIRTCCKVKLYPHFDGLRGYSTMVFPKQPPGRDCNPRVRSVPVVFPQLQPTSDRVRRVQGDKYR